MIKVKRVYDPVEADDGPRFLVDRLWPRGMKKEDLHLQGWLKNIAPSDALRRFFGHDPKKWEEFRRRYFTELDKKSSNLQIILEFVRKGCITLLHSAQDTENRH